MYKIYNNNCHKNVKFIIGGLDNSDVFLLPFSRVPSINIFITTPQEKWPHQHNFSRGGIPLFNAFLKLS